MFLYSAGAFSKLFFQIMFFSGVVVSTLYDETGMSASVVFIFAPILTWNWPISVAKRLKIAVEVLTSCGTYFESAFFDF